MYLKSPNQNIEMILINVDDFQKHEKHLISCISVWLKSLLSVSLFPTRCLLITLHSIILCSCLALCHCRALEISGVPVTLHIFSFGPSSNARRGLGWALRNAKGLFYNPDLSSTAKLHPDLETSLTFTRY